MDMDLDTGLQLSTATTSSSASLPAKLENTDPHFDANLPLNTAIHDRIDQTEREVERINPEEETQQQQQQQQQASEATVEDWSSQTFQMFECAFSPALKDGTGDIVQSFTTKQTFNSTVEETRIQMGIQNDSHRMTNGRENNFFKALKWSPDGTCLLSSTNDNCLRIFALPDATTATPEDTQLTPGVLIKEGEAVYDMCWYPAMNSQDPATCCVLSSSRDHPVHLWDAYTGELRCSYTIVDHCEVNVAPNVLCFNLDGSKIYCGSNNMIQIFDTSRPGRDSFKRPTVPTRKSNKGQKGVISCLTFNPDHSDVYAAGSYLKTIGLYDARAEELIVLLRNKTSSRPTAQNHRHHRQQTRGDVPSHIAGSASLRPMGGLTQVQFSPDGQYLYSAARQDPWIRCWDIRNTATVLHYMERPGELTNQRINFDISSDGRWLTTGDMNGDVSVFDLRNPGGGGPQEEEGEGEEKRNEPSVRLAARFHAHDDVVSAATFHPSGAILATSSGQRKYDLQFHSVDSTDSSGSESDNDTQTVKRERRLPGLESKTTDPATVASAEVDNSIRLWTLPGKYVWYVNGQRWSADESSGGAEAGSPSMNMDTTVMKSTTPDGSVAIPAEATDMHLPLNPGVVPTLQGDSTSGTLQ